MIDFSEAETKGMALRVSLPAAVVTAGIDNLVVFGVSSSLNAADSAAQLAGVLDAHHYTDGLDFLRFGTPTNNTDDRRAPQLVDDPGHARSYGNEIVADPTKYAAASNATRVGVALGLDPNAPVLGHVAHASDQHETDMHSMNSALWQVGWGNFLSNMIGFDGTGLTPAAIDWARDYFVSYVRAGGPFPVLRAGYQPYGVLPVTSLDLWKPRTGDEQLLAPDDLMRQLLIKLRDSVWRSRLPADTLRLGRRFNATTGPNPDADLADVMRTDGISSGVQHAQRVRRAVLPAPRGVPQPEHHGHRHGRPGGVERHAPAEARLQLAAARRACRRRRGVVAGHRAAHSGR